MTAPTKVIHAPPSGITYHDPGILRPQSELQWSGEVAGVDIRFQWDTDNTFGGGVDEVVDVDVGGASGGTFSLTFNGQTTQPLDFDVPITAVDEVQTLFNGATGGTFHIDFDGQGPTVDLDFDAVASAVKAALEGLSNIDNVSVTGAGTSGDPWIITYDGPQQAGKPIPELTTDDTNLTGGTPTSTIATTTQGKRGLKKELEDLSGIHVVTVTGSGTFADPYQITHTDPINSARNLPDMTGTDIDLSGGSGLIVTVSTAGVTGPPIDILVFDDAGNAYEQAPDSDLGLTGQPWFWRVAVIDRDDGLGGWTSAQTLNYLDPIVHDRHLTHQANVGVGFDPTDAPGGGWGTGGTVGPDGATLDFARFLDHEANVGVGFSFDEPAGGWGPNSPETDAPDGVGRDFDRYLTHQANVDDTQPCPLMFSLSKTTGEFGDTIIVSGQGLVSADDPTDAFDAEVRLYEAPNFGAAFVVMPTVTWDAGETLDTITVTIPTGSSSGFVAVVHTTGATCSGSNFIGLIVVAVPPDNEAGWWVEAWNLRNTAPILTPIFNIATADFEMIPGDIGNGAMGIPADHPEIATMLDRSADPPVQTLLKVYQHGRFSYAFIPADIEDTYDEDGARLSRLFGAGQETILTWGQCLWKDYPKQPSTTRTWLYGSTDNVAPWGDMEPNNALTNPGAEDAALDPWTEVGNPNSSADTSEAKSGTYSIKVTPNALDEGIEQTFGGREDKDGFCDVWLKVNTIGGTYTIEVLDIDDDDNDVVLESVVVVPGSAAWALFTLEFTSPSDQQLRLRVTQTAGALETFWIDDLTAFTDLPTSFEETRVDLQLSRAEVADGQHSLKLICDAGGDTSFNGVTGFFSVTPAQDYTLQVSVAGVTGEVLRFAVRLGGVLTSIEHTITAAPFDTIQILGKAGDNETTARFTWNSLESGAMTFFVDAFTITPGANAANPGQIITDVHTAMIARLTLDFIQLGFTTTTDSKGQAWIENLAFEVNPEWTLWDLVEKFVGLGYGTEFVPVNWRGGGDTGWVLHLYNPNTIGEDWTDVPLGPVLLPGDTLESARPSAAPPLSTVVFGEGEGGIWSVAEAAVDTIAALERREEFVTNRSARDNTTLFRAVSHRLNISTSRGAQVTALLTDAGDPLPFLSFLPADSMRVHLPQSEFEERDLVAEDTYRVAAIAAHLTADGRQQAYEVDFGLAQLHADRIRDLVTARLLDRGTAENYQPGTGSVSQGGSSGSGSTASAVAGVPGETAVHAHTWPEIQPNVAAGDLGGTYPNPSVTGLRGRPISSVPPTDRQALEFDAASGRYIPTDGKGAWQTPSLLNSWVDFGGTWATAQYRRDRTGMVHIKGRVKDGTVTAGTVLFTLALGFRPAEGLIFAVDGNGAHAQINVEPDGDVVLQAGASATSTALSISFLADG